MSNRSLIEINHDFTHDLGPEFLEALGRYLRSADDKNAEALERWGVRVVGLRHHSEKFYIDSRAEGFPPFYLTPAKGNRP